MDLNQHKTEVKSRLVEAIATAIENKQLTEDQLPDIADFILQNMDKAQNHQEVVAITLQLASRYPIFQNIAMIEQGEEKRVVEEQVADKMIDLIKNGQTTDAINLSQSVIQK